MNKFLKLIIESIKSPKKFVFVFKKKYLTIPSLDFLKKIKIEKVKLIYINFWIYFSKKNLSFKHLFFNKSDFYEKNIFNFDKNNIINNEIIKSLSFNGIIIVENILDEINLSDIKSKVQEIQLHKAKNNFSSEEFKLNISDDKKRERLIYDPSNFNYEELNLLTNSFSSLVYGKQLEPSRDLYIDYCHDVPEKKVRGDNYLHVDRFLPNLKILFSPFDITINEAPFSYALNSHKINSNYKKFIINAKNFDETDEGAFEFIEKKKSFLVKSNSAIIAFTNGFHGRTSFEKSGKRIILFHQYNRSFTKLSFFNYMTFNKKNQYFKN